MSNFECESENEQQSPKRPRDFLLTTSALPPLLLALLGLLSLGLSPLALRVLLGCRSGRRLPLRLRRRTLGRLQQAHKHISTRQPSKMSTFDKPNCSCLSYTKWTQLGLTKDAQPGRSASQTHLLLLDPLPLAHQVLHLLALLVLALHTPPQPKTNRAALST